MSKNSKPVIGSIKNKIVASDLLAERANCDFNKDGGILEILNKEHMDRYQEAIEFMESDPILQNSHHFYEMSRDELWKSAMQKMKRAFELGKKKWFHDHECNQIAWSEPLQGQSPGTLNQTMFLLSLQNMCNEQQRTKWEPLCKQYKIMGTYAQTEIGHGSDVSSLKTTATLDKSTDEFVINTPSIDAYKWWPGDMGNFSSHAIVFAKLIIDGNSYGVMPFLAQLRDLDTWQPLKGVECGDMGSKMGYHSKNNGWLRMNNIRIPRDQMLMKFASVDKNGNFELVGDLRILYSVMMDIRIQILQASGGHLLQSLCIGLRYSVVRRQFKNTFQSKEETKLLDYQTQQHKLLPLLSIGFAMMITHSYILDMYNQLKEDIKKGDFSLLDLMHHYTSGMKSVFSQYTMDGLMLIRQSLGGAGYTNWSGLPYKIEDFSPVVTFEGDNTVMAMQSQRYLQKIYKKAKNGEKIEGILEYINEINSYPNKVCKAKSPQDFCEMSQVDEALKYCSLYLIENTVQRIKENNASQIEKQNQIFSLDIIKMSQLHIKYVTFRIMRQKINGLTCEKKKGHFQNMCILMGLTILEQYKTCGYESGYFRQGTSNNIDEAIKIILQKIRPQAIPLIELMNYPDSVLVSAIGNSYGDIYETHLEWARNSRLNNKNGNIPDGFLEYVMPILKSKL